MFTPVVPMGLGWICCKHVDQKHVLSGLCIDTEQSSNGLDPTCVKVSSVRALLDHCPRNILGSCLSFIFYNFYNFYTLRGSMEVIKSVLSNFPVSVYLTGGIVGVAGQFRDWQFAAFGMYPFISCLYASVYFLRNHPCAKHHRGQSLPNDPVHEKVLWMNRFF